MTRAERAALKKKIIDGLQHCLSGGCDGCPYDGEAERCTRELMRDMLRLMEVSE